VKADTEPPNARCRDPLSVGWGGSLMERGRARSIAPRAPLLTLGSPRRYAAGAAAAGAGAASPFLKASVWCCSQRPCLKAFLRHSVFEQTR